MFKTEKLINDPRAIKALTGLSYDEFTQLIPVFKKAESEIQTKGKKRERAFGGGKLGVLKTREERLFCVLFYLKNYPTFDVIGYLFGFQRGHACEAIHRYLEILEKALGKKHSLPERKINSVEEFLIKFPFLKEVAIDGVERRIQRPKNKKKQNKSYSGKKKSNTKKVIIVSDSKKKVLILTKPKSGRRHDKKITDKNLIIEHIPENVLILADSGFQGIQHTHKNTWLPWKGTKKNPLSAKQKEHNHILASFRVVVEHSAGGMKRFRAFSEVFRNKIEKLVDQVTLISAGLWNYHLDFAS